ncbi:RNase H domain-containing protein [Trichonephila clavipes]|nr:RNase H domain-containing protein [Trichonephila clavipes]
MPSCRSLRRLPLTPEHRRLRVTSGLDNGMEQGHIFKRLILLFVQRVIMMTQSYMDDVLRQVTLSFIKERGRRIAFSNQKLEKVQFSAAQIITGLRNTCPRDIILFEADLQPLSLRRRACLTKYYNKLRSLDSRNRTSAYIKDWCNNQRLRRNSSFSQMVSFNLTIGAVEPHHLSQCLGPTDDLDGVFFHPELPVYTDGSRDDYYRSGSGIYIKSQDHILRIQRRNPDGSSGFRSELIAIDEALGSLASLPNGKDIWILSDSRSAIQHLSNWQSVRDNVGVSILTKLKRLSTSHQIHLQWIPSHTDLEGNEIADTLDKAGASCLVCSHPRVPRAHQAGFSRRSLAGVGLSESVRCHGPGLALLTNGGVQQQHQHQNLYFCQKYFLDYWDKFLGEVGDIAKISQATHGRKRVRSELGGVVHKIIGGNRSALLQSFELKSPAEEYSTV